METPIMHAKKSTNFGNKKEKTQMLCLMLHKQLPLSIHSYSETSSSMISCTLFLKAVLIQGTKFNFFKKSPFGNLQL